MPGSRYPIDILLTALAPLIWGSTYLVTTEFLPPDRPFTAAVIRCLPAGMLLLLWTRRLPRRDEWGRTALLSFFNIGLFQSLLFVSAYRLPGGIAAILTATQVLMVLLFAWLIGREHVRMQAWIAAAVGVLGVALLVLSPDAAFDTVGVLAALLGAASMAAGLFFSKHWKSSLPVLAFTGWQLLLGGLMMLPVALWTEPLPETISLGNVAGYLYLCLIGSVLTYALFFRGLQRLPSPVVSVLGLLSPVCAFLLGWVFLDQAMDARSMLGFMLVLGSIYGVQRFTQLAQKS